MAASVSPWSAPKVRWLRALIWTEPLTSSQPVAVELRGLSMTREARVAMEMLPEPL